MILVKGMFEFCMERGWLDNNWKKKNSDIYTKSRIKWN